MTRRPDSDRQNRTITTCRDAGSALLTIGYAHAYAPSLDNNCTELAREPWGTGGVWRVAVRPYGITRDNEERSWAPRRLPGYRASSPTTLPRPIALTES